MKPIETISSLDLIDDVNIAHVKLISNEFKRYGIDSSDLYTNGYNFEFYSTDKKVLFCDQGERFTGEICRIKTERPLNISCPDIRKSTSEWAEFTKKYDFRPFCLWGNIPKRVDNLINLLNLSIEEYIASRIAYENLIGFISQTSAQIHSAIGKSETKVMKNLDYLLANHLFKEPSGLF